MVAVTLLVGLEVAAATMFTIRLANRFARKRPAGGRT